MHGSNEAEEFRCSPAVDHACMSRAALIPGCAHDSRHRPRVWYEAFLSLLSVSHSIFRARSPHSIHAQTPESVYYTHTVHELIELAAPKRDRQFDFDKFFSFFRGSVRTRCCRLLRYFNKLTRELEERKEGRMDVKIQIPSDPMKERKNCLIRSHLYSRRGFIPMLHEDSLPALEYFFAVSYRISPFSVLRIHFSFSYWTMNEVF